LFKFENNEVRTVEIDNELWFIAKDVAKILEYSDTFKMCNRLDDDEKLNANLAVQVNGDKCNAAG